MNLITVAEVRRISGVTSTSLASDEDVTDSIAEAEAQIDKELNTAFIPKEKIDVLDGNGTVRIFVMKNPLLAVRALKIDGTSITLAGNLFISKESGKLELNTNSTPEETTFKAKKQSIIVKYVYGWLEESNTSTTTSASSTAGSSVALSVSSESGFAVNDWIEIYGMDGFREAAKVTAVSTNQITVDSLSFTHESGSKVVKLQVNEAMKKLIRLISGISLVARVVGESFDDITGYSLEELRVQKGEPFTQWRETALQLNKQAEEIRSKIGRRPAIF